ncbi:MAG: alpha/beta hydrolase, partial [Gemmataceae bacterium]|nr:alpha/beta hydrolase [Gemmataceae bacterium]
MTPRSLFAALALLSQAPTAPAQFGLPKQPAEPNFTRTEDVVYGRRDGHALTLDVFAPKDKKPNGAAVIFCVSAGFQSSKESLDRVHALIVPEFTGRGYTVFAVMHSSLPKYSIPEIVEDMHRAVRFVKAGAKKYHIDPDKVGIAGASSGGHLSLMMGCDGRAGDPDAKDEVERQSSRVAAVACFFPPTDFPAFEKNPPKEFDPEGLFPFRELKNGKYVNIDEKRRQEIGRACSPLYC